MDTCTIWSLLFSLYLEGRVMCMSACVCYYFLSILFKSLSKCLMRLSCVPGTVPGTASVNKVTFALKELTL